MGPSLSPDIGHPWGILSSIGKPPDVKTSENTEKARLMQLQFSSVAQSWTTFCDCMDRSTPGLPVHHQVPELTQTHVH